VFARLSDKGIQSLQQVATAVMAKVHSSRLNAYRAAWLQQKHMMRLVCREFKCLIDHHCTQDDDTKELRTIVGRQKKVIDFFKAKGVPLPQPAPKATKGAFLMKSKQYVDDGGDDWINREDNHAHVNIYDALGLDGQSHGNAVVDERSLMTSDELLEDLRKERMTRLKAKAQFLLSDGFSANLSLPASPSEDQRVSESDREEDLRLSDDRSVSGSDSEAWAAMEDSDLSDASIRTASISSGSDFH
jgi:hypothetical protein